MLTIRPTRKIIHTASLIGLALWLAGCGRERVTPTPIPASVVRPAQPTPVYGQSTVFRLTTPVAEGVIVTPVPTANPPPPVVAATPAPAVLPVLQNPSALGIATSGATLLAAPGGAAVVTLPVGTTVTVTGKAADGRYLAAYLEDGRAGWIATGQLTLFGADDLLVVAEASGPGPAATLLAEAMQPVRVLDELVVTPMAADNP